MTIFAVMGLSDLSALAENIKGQFPNDHYEVSQDKWFVAATGQTTEQIAARIGMTPDKKITGIVITLSGYNGLASKNIWEWLKVKTSEHPPK